MHVDLALVALAKMADPRQELSSCEQLIHMFQVFGFPSWGACRRHPYIGSTSLPNL